MKKTVDQILILLQEGLISRLTARQAIEGQDVILPDPKGEPLPEQTIAIEMWAQVYPDLLIKQ
jgi:hypothetical protein